MPSEPKSCECGPGGCPSATAHLLCAAMERYCKIAGHDALREKADSVRLRQVARK